MKRRKNNTKKKRNGKDFKAKGAEARKINASTVYETCTQQLTPFGALLALIKIDSTVETIVGNQQGGRKGHNTKYRGKKALRLILCFIDETREYLMGKLRKGQTVSGKEAADFIKKLKSHLPGCVQQVLLRADGEFLNWPAIAACIEAGFDFIIESLEATDFIVYLFRKHTLNSPIFAINRKISGALSFVRSL